MDKHSHSKKKIKLVEKYDNDEPFQIGEEEFSQSSHSNKRDIHLHGEGSWHHPGVSGKIDGDETWINSKEYRKKTNFIGYGPKGYKRSDDRIFEEVCDKLMSDREVDASNIGVKVENGIVFLSGKVDSRRTKKLAELIVEDLPGVQDVRNELVVIKGDSTKSGPEASLKKDLGI